MTEPRITPEDRRAAHEWFGRIDATEEQLAACIAHWRERAETAERAGLRYYNADGSFTVLDSAEEVIERRRVAAQAIARLERERDEAEHSRTFNHEAAKAALDQRDAWQAHAERLREALYGITLACLEADSHEELGDVNMLAVDAARLALGDCPACDRWGTVDRQDHCDEILTPENTCPRCSGWGFSALATTPAASLTERDRRVAEQVREAAEKMRKACHAARHAVYEDGAQWLGREREMGMNPDYTQGWLGALNELATRFNALDVEHVLKGEQP